MRGPLVIGVALKWAPAHVEVDPLTGAASWSPRLAGPSLADLAALEWGLRLAEAWDGEVVAATAGPPASDDVLRGALAAGARRAARSDVPLDAPSCHVAAGLAGIFRRAGLVFCGDRSPDRGSGAVPPLLAARLGAAQACGVVGVEPEEDGRLLVERRLDSGRRERLRLGVRGVISVEASTARLRRASFPGMLAARSATIDVVPGPPAERRVRRLRQGPLRPRTHVVPGPDPERGARERTLSLLGSDGGTRKAGTPLTLDPPDAAERILASLAEWGYLE